VTANCVVLRPGYDKISGAPSAYLLRSRTTRDIHQWAENFKVYTPFETKLSDMAYDKYHLFHPTSRMLPGYTAVPDKK